MNRYICDEQGGMWIVRSNGNPIMNEEKEIWIKEKDYIEEKSDEESSVKSRLNLVRICLNSDVGTDIKVDRIYRIITKKQKHLDKNGREIKHGDITRIKSEHSSCVFEIKGSNIYNLESGLYVESLKKVDSSDMEVIGKRV